MMKKTVFRVISGKKINFFWKIYKNQELFFYS